eukprot:56611-Chlamydomonas_euryale.AAC.1
MPTTTPLAAPALPPPPLAQPLPAMLPPMPAPMLQPSPVAATGAAPAMTGRSAAAAAADAGAAPPPLKPETRVELSRARAFSGVRVAPLLPQLVSLGPPPKE